MVRVWSVGWVISSGGVKRKRKRKGWREREEAVSYSSSSEILWDGDGGWMGYHYYRQLWCMVCGVRAGQWAGRSWVCVCVNNNLCVVWSRLRRERGRDCGRRRI